MTLSEESDVSRPWSSKIWLAAVVVSWCIDIVLLATISWRLRSMGLSQKSRVINLLSGDRLSELNSYQRESNQTAGSPHSGRSHLLSETPYWLQPHQSLHIVRRRSFPIWGLRGHCPCEQPRMTSIVSQSLARLFTSIHFVYIIGAMSLCVKVLVLFATALSS